MKIYLPMYQFILLALSTALSTYFFNSALMMGQFLYAGFWGLFLGRNVYSSYQLSKFVRMVEEQVAKKKKTKKRP